jgi:CRP/FNR family transcriptional regulator, cyclic AMP receptor protein
VRADAESLRRIPIFKDCESVPLQVLAFASERQRFSGGSFLMEEGKRVNAAYFILEGRAQILRGGEEIGRADPGALLGETAMLGNSPATLSARAEGDVRCARIDAQLFQRVAGEYPEFGQSVLAALSLRLQVSVRELEVVRTQLTKARSFSSLKS